MGQRMALVATAVLRASSQVREVLHQPFPFVSGCQGFMAGHPLSRRASEQRPWLRTDQRPPPRSTGLCRPCQFMRNRKGCLDGADCVHCHYPHEEMTNSAIRRAHRRASAEKREPLKVGPERPMTRSESTTPGDVFSELFTPTTASERDQSEGSQEVDAQDSAGRLRGGIAPRLGVMGVW